MMIFVNVCSTWNIVQIKTRFETTIPRIGVYGVSSFHLSYLITLMAFLCSQMTQNAQINYFMLDWSIYTLFLLNRGWKRESLQIIIFVHICSTWSIVEIKTRFEKWITRNDVYVVSLFNLSYLITLMACLCSQQTPKVQIKYFMFDWSIYRLFVLNMVWKRDPFQMIIFLNSCSTWSIVQLKLNLRRQFQDMTYMV
jgi:hypothetical protein